MSIVAEFFNGSPNAKQLRKALDGNICRCTGYNAINQALSDIEESAIEIQPPKFPEELKLAYPGARVVNANYQNEVYKNQETIQPSSLAQLKDFLTAHPDVYYLSGVTELMIDYKESNKMPRFIVSLQRMAELQFIANKNHVLEIGASTTLHQFETYLKQNGLEKQHKFFEYAYETFASHHIRQSATIVGNIVNASPVSDNLPIFMCLNAVLNVLNVATGTERQVKVDDLVTGYRKTCLIKGELVRSLTVDLNGFENTFYKKLSRRRHDDIAISNCCCRFVVEQQTVKSARIVFGCVDNVTKHMVKLEQYFTNLDAHEVEPILKRIDEIVTENYSYPPTQIRTEPDWKTGMIATMVSQFFLEAIKSSKQFEQFVYSEKYSHTYSYDEPTKDVITQNVKHISAAQQATGEALYPSTAGYNSGQKCLHAYPVFAVVPKGTFEVKFTCEEAKQKYPAFIDFVTAKDIKGRNLIGVAMPDEKVLVPEGTEFISPAEVLGVVIAETHEDAFNIAKLLVKENMIKITPAADPITTIEDAVARNSFTVARRLDRIGNEQKPDPAKFEKLIEDLKKNPDVVVFSHSMTTPAQEQFYLEPQGTIASIAEDQIVLNAGTQNQKGTQSSVAAVLGIPCAQITVNTKRLGGGFGGKEGCFEYSVLAAIATQKLNKPVSLFLDYIDDIQFTGKRHEAQIEGTLYFNKKTKKIELLDVKADLDGGYSMDLSPAVLERFVYHLDNTYAYNASRFQGRVCKTNLRSNTAFRGFGAPQAIIFIETLLQSLAKQEKLCVNEIREANYYKDTDRTPYGQLIGEIPLTQVAQQTMEKAGYKELKKQVDEFNLNHHDIKQGIAFCPLKFGVSFGQSFLNQGHALVHVFTDGSVAVSHGGIEMGQGLNTRIFQVVCQEFGIEQKYVRVMETSTITTANTAPTSASSGYDLNAAAVVDAIKKIKAQMGDLYDKFSSKELQWPQVCNAAWFARKCLSANGHYSHPQAGFNFETQTGQPFCYFATSGAVCHVQVNKKTGEYQVLKAELVIDVGQTINPMIDIGQIEGAFLQGMGWLTTEELLFKQQMVGGKPKRTGRYATFGPGTYKVPSIYDVPNEFNIHLLKGQYNQKVVYGSKGVGEPPLCLGVAVFLALREAAGESLKAPATVMSVWRAK